MRHLNDALLLETFMTNLRASDLSERKLSPWIISLRILKKAMGDIQTILENEELGYKLVTTDPRYYYQFAKFTMLRNESVMYIAIRFPLATYEQSFSAYKVMSFPVPINDSENHASQLLNLQDYLLVSKDKQFYTTLSEKTMAQCQKNSFIVIKNLISIRYTIQQIVSLIYFKEIQNKLKIHVIFVFLQMN